MRFTEAIKHVFKNYVTFTGRACRSEYWYFVLFSVVVSLILTRTPRAISYIYSAAVFLPSLAVTVRRLHDIGKSGWFWLLSIIPVVGPIILIVWFCRDSDPGPNEYGPNPKEVPLDF